MSTFSPPPRLGRILDAQVSAADVRIEGMQIRSRRVTRSRVTHDVSIDIKSDNDDWARNVRCVVVLPPTAHLIALDPPALTGPASPPWATPTTRCSRSPPPASWSSNPRSP